MKRYTFECTYPGCDAEKKFSSFGPGTAKSALKERYGWGKDPNSKFGFRCPDHKPTNNNGNGN